MLAISQQIILNNWVCFILGSVANTLLLWLVWKRTPVELRAYSRILAQAAILNLANILATQLFQPMLLSRGAYSMACGLGWAVLDPQGGEFNRQWNILLFGASVFAWFSSVYTMALSFYCRYVIMCSVEKLSVGRYTLGLLITTGLGLALAISNGVMAELSEKHFNAANEIFTPEETRWIVTFSGPEESTYNKRIHSMVILLDIFTYVVIGYFSVRIWLHVRNQSSHIPDARARAINRQLTITLLAQALTPLVLIIGPEFYVIVTTLIGSQQEKSNLQAFFISWLPVIDGLLALIIIRPYRMVVMRALRLARPSQVEPIMVVSATGMNARTHVISISPTR